MFGFTPPATPQQTSHACPHCESHDAIALYATTRTEYFRCVHCRQVWTATRDDVPFVPGASSAAAA